MKSFKHVPAAVSFLSFFLFFCGTGAAFDYVEDTQSWNRILKLDSSHGTYNSLAIDKEGNVYVAGSALNMVNARSDWDWIIKKYSKDGVEDTLHWAKAIDSNLGDDSFRTIALDHEDNLYAVGYCSRMSPQSPRMGLWIKKFTPDGKETAGWDKKIDIEISSGSAAPQSTAIAFDSANNVYVISCYRTTWSEKKAESFWLVKKFDVDGHEDIRWNKVIGAPGSFNWPMSIHIDKADRVFISGIGDSVAGETGPVAGKMNYDWWIKKFDTEGNEDTDRWDKRVDGAGGWDWAYAMKTDHDGNLYVAGFGDNLISPSSTYDCWIKRFTPQGEEDTDLWNKVFADADNGSPVTYPNQDCIEALAIDSRNNVVVAGFATDTKYEYSFLKVISSDGKTNRDIVSDVRNTIPFSGTYAVAVDADDSIFIAGNIINLALDRRDLFLKKYEKVD